MGIFGTGSFDNDNACDFYFSEFMKSPGKDKLFFYLEHKEIFEVRAIAEKAVAAAEIMALFKERHKKDNNLGELDVMFETYFFNFDETDYFFASSVLKKIMQGSEAEKVRRTVYQDSYEEWKRELLILIDRLEVLIDAV